MVNVRIQKSPVPIVWLDTSVIHDMTKFKASPTKLERVQRDRIGRLYELVRKASRAGTIICPLAGQDREIWAERDNWTDTIHDLGLGIECASERTIQDAQLRTAITAYMEHAQVIHLSYHDAFVSDPVEELGRVLRQDVFVTVRQDIFGGAGYQRRKKAQTLEVLNQARAQNLANRVTLEQQLQTEHLGELQLLLSQSLEVVTGHSESPQDENAFWGYMRLSELLNEWVTAGGHPPDLLGFVEFYKSEYNLTCPYNHLRTILFAKIMVDPQPVRSGDPMDITHISTLMPYADLFITDKAWSAFLNREGLAERYCTKVCYIGDSGEISAFLEPLAA